MAAQPRLAVIDYGSGNLRSVAKAFEHVGAQVQIIDEASQLGEVDGLVLPGVGALGHCVEGLRRGGFDQLVASWIAEDRPFMGVCLGFQALFEHSEEGNCKGLGIFGGQVRRFRLPESYKVPHMGWNAVRFSGETGLSAQLPPSGSQFYFVHSYRVEPEDESIVWCRTDYGEPFCSGIARGNCYAVQFHPEKSQACGLQMYAAFLHNLSPVTGAA